METYNLLMFIPSRAKSQKLISKLEMAKTYQFDINDEDENDFTYLLLRNSRDFAINGRAVTLDTVNKFSLSSSSTSLLGIGMAAIVLVEKFC